MKCLLHLYPPAWKRRYRREMEEHLQKELPRFRTALDLIAGAIDAWLNPQWIPEAKNAGGEKTMITASRCGPADISAADAGRSAAWMLGVTFALTAVGVALDKTVGDHFAIEALIYSSFFIALTVSSHETFLKPYSRAARSVVIAASAVGWYGFFLVVGAIAAVT